MLSERTRPPRRLERPGLAVRHAATRDALSGWRAFAACGVLGVLGVCAPRRALADDSNVSCANRSEAAQHERVEHHLLQARGDFRACAQAPCTSFIRSDCEAGLHAVEHDLPTIVIAVRSEGRNEELTAAQVSVDGAPTNYLRGVQVELDPGLHSINATAPSGSEAELQIVAREGEKSRIVTLVVPSPPAPAAPPLTERTPTPLPARHTAEKVLGGAALGLVLLSAGFDVAAYSRYRSLDSSCGNEGNCSPAPVSTATALARTGDVLLGVGLAAAAAGLVVYLVHGSSAAPATATSWLTARPLSSPVPSWPLLK